jgi:hypothetical protein
MCQEGGLRKEEVSLEGPETGYELLVLQEKLE